MFDHRHLAVALPASPGAGSSDPRGVRASDPRRRILDALVHVVALRGYKDTTIERLLDLAEVPAPVFDEHFESLEDCLLVALDEQIERLRLAVVKRADSASWSERVRLGLEDLLSALADDPDGARVALVECLSAGEPAIVRLRRAMAGIVPILEQGRSEAADTGHLPPQTSEAIVGGIASILHRHVLEDRTAELPGLRDDLLYFTLMPYLGHERALSEARACRA